MVVDEIVDVVEEAAKVRKKSDRKGLLGSAVVGKRVTDFLDLNAVIRASEGNWDASAGGHANGKSVLIADASSFSRGMIKAGLDMAGYMVLEAANLEDAVRWLERHPVDAIVAALDLPNKGSSVLLAALRRRPEWVGIPVLALADSVDQARVSAATKAGFRGCQARNDQELVIDAVARMVAPPDTFDAEMLCAKEER
jgi:CheY-like chemotaxis protein